MTKETGGAVITRLTVDFIATLDTLKNIGDEVSIPFDLASPGNVRSQVSSYNSRYDVELTTTAPAGTTATKVIRTK